MSDNNNIHHTESPTERLSRPLENSFERIANPFYDFIKNQTVASGILLAATLLAILLANSDYAHDYEAFFHNRLGIIFSDFIFERSIHYWINEGIMALFFFIIGLEIKRELLVGELKNLNRAVTVIAAAMGGMLLPAAIYLAINATTDTIHGWGIPMATDTAFVIGILALLRKHVPTALVVFITALAILDDIGAILIIAFFYTETVSLIHLAYAAGIMALMILLNLMGVRGPTPYLLVGGLLWLAMLESGIHATIAGILAAMAVPARAKHDPIWFVDRARKLLSRFERREKNKETDNTILADPEQHELVEEIHEVAEQASTPLQRWEHALETPIAILVLPIFAFANAGVELSRQTLAQHLIDPLALGIIMGLLVGKCAGITTATWLVLKLGLGSMPDNVQFNHIIGISMLAGIGFTMSLFVAGLGFSSSPEHLNIAKTSVLFASLVAGICGYLWLRFRVPK